jgi:glycerol kinase
MQRDSGITLKGLRCDGGAAVNDTLMQFQSDILGVEVEVPGQVETTALGAAYLAGLAVGFWEDRAQIARLWTLGQRYSPQFDEATRGRLFRRWHKAVALAKGWALDE